MSEPESGRVAQPIVIDLGTKRKKQLKRLKCSEGKLLVQVMETVRQVHDGLGADAEGKILLPVVLIYREKRPRSLFGF